MGAGASAQAQAQGDHGAQIVDDAKTQINEVFITPVELTDNTRRAVLKWKEHALMKKAYKCEIERPEAERILRWIGLSLGDAKGDVCTAIESLLHMTHLNVRMTSFRAHGSYGMVIDAFTLDGQQVVVKILLLSEDRDDDDAISNRQFGNAVKIQRALAEKTYDHLHMSELKDVLRIRINHNLIGIEVMKFIEGKTASEVLATAMLAEDPRLAEEVVRLLAMALREFCSQGYVHGDPHLNNYLINGDKVTLIDFDFASRSEDTAVDLFKTLSSIGGVCKKMGKLQVFESLIKIFIDTFFEDKDTSHAFLAGLAAEDDDDLYRQVSKNMIEDYMLYRDSLP